MSFRLFPLHEKMGAEDLRNTLANICADYSPDTKATILLNMDDPPRRVSILFYPDGTDVTLAEVISGPTWVDALNSLIERIEKGKTRNFASSSNTLKPEERNSFTRGNILSSREKRPKPRSII